jgi:hypothetical protein
MRPIGDKLHATIQFINPDRTIYGQMSLRQAKIVARNLLQGKPYHCASPQYSLTRNELAYIHTHAEEILAMEE